MHYRLLLAALVSAAVLPLKADQEPTPPPAVAEVVREEVIILEDAPPPADASEEEKADYWQSVRAKYEAAKDATGDYYERAKSKTGEYYDKAKDTTTGWYEDARDWTQDDIKKAGAWHYRVIVVSRNDLARDPDKVTGMLNALGVERYECFWVEPLDEDHTKIAFFFKKSGFSYLKSIQATEFWRFMPKGGDGDTGDASGAQ